MAWKKINVLYVIDTLFVGGAEKHVATLCRHIDREKFHVSVCTLFSRDLSAQEPYAVEIEKMGIRVERLGLASWRDFETFKKYLRVIDKENCDIVHAHTVPADFWGCLVAKMLRRRKTIMTLHGPSTNPTFASRLQRIGVKSFFSDKIIACSSLLKSHVMRENYGRDDKIVVIPNQVDTSVFIPSNKGGTIRAEYNIPHDAIVLGSVGRFVKNKGFDTCLHIFAKVQKKHPQSKFILCGYGAEEASYRQLIRRLGIEGSVIICARTDVEEVMAAIDVFLFLPYGSEGFGLVVIEAMSSGKPVIASNVQPIPDIVTDCVTGFLPFPERVTTYMEKVCIEPFVEKILYLIENPVARENMGMEGRKRVEEKYSTDVVMKQIERLYEVVASNSFGL